MENLEYEKLIATLARIEVILSESGFPKGSVQIGFNPKSLDGGLSALSSMPKSVVAPIKTAKFECHFGGCGLICCTF